MVSIRWYSAFLKGKLGGAGCRLLVIKSDIELAGSLQEMALVVEGTDVL